MLKVLRQKQRAKKIILGIIVGIMTLAFVLWGAGAYKQSLKESNYAGVISGRRVTNSEFRKIRISCVNDLRFRFGEAYNQLLPFIDLNNQAWVKLILLDYARRQKISASNQEVVQEIATNPLFSKDGKFNQDNYNRIVRYYLNTQPRDFEEQTRLNLVIRKLYVRATKDITLSDEEILDAYKRDHETLSINYLRLNSEDFLSSVKASNEETEDYYRKDSGQFRRPPTVSIEYVGIDFPPETPDETERIKIFDEVRYSYANIKNAQKLKEAAKGKISYHRPEPFSLNETVDGIGSEEFYKYCFSLKEGQTSPLIQADKGVYVLRIIQKKDSYIPPLEEIKTKVEETIKLEKAKVEAKNKAEEYRNKIDGYLKDDSSMNLKKAGELLGVEVKTTPAFSRDQALTDIEISLGLRNQAFGLGPNRISGVLNEALAYYIIEQDKLTPIDQEKFKQDKEAYGKNLLEEKQKTAFNKLQQEIISKVNLKKYTPEEEEK